VERYDRAWPWRIWLCIFTGSGSLGRFTTTSTCFVSKNYKLDSHISHVKFPQFKHARNRTCHVISNARYKSAETKLPIDCTQADMARRGLVLDGLWYSLCPSFSALSLSRSTTFPKPKGRARKLHTLPPIPSASSVTRRCYNTSTGDNARPPYDTTHNNDQSGPREPGENADRDSGLSPDPTNAGPPMRQKVPLYTRTHRVQDDLLGMPNDRLEARLQYVMYNKPNIRHITQILRLLIRDRHVQPNARHYKALILANTDNERGSPEIVRGLLEEMEDNGITADSGTLHGALQVCYLGWADAMSSYRS
jgi:hypothetical protein